MDKKQTEELEKEYNDRIHGIIDQTLYSDSVPQSRPKTAVSAKSASQSATQPVRHETAPISLESFDKAYDRHMRQVHEQLEHSRRLAQQVNAPSAQSDRDIPPPPPKRSFSSIQHDIIPDETILLEEASNMARRTVTNASWQDNTERVVVAASLGKHSSLEDTTKDRIARERHNQESDDEEKPVFPFQKIKDLFDLGRTSSGHTPPVQSPKVNAARLASTLQKNLRRTLFRLTVLAVPGVLLLYQTLAVEIGLPLPFFWDHSTDFLSAGIINLCLFSVALFAGWDAVKSGFRRLVSLRVNSDSVIALSAVFTWLYGLLSVSVSAWRCYPPPFILPVLWLLFRNLFRYYTFTARYRSVRAVSRYSEAETLHLSTDGGYDGLPTYIRTDSSGFNRYFYSLKTENPGEQIVNLYMSAALVISFLFSLITAFLPPEGAVGGHIFQALSFFFSMIPSCALILGYAPSYAGIASRMRRSGAFIGGPHSFLGYSREGFTVVTDRDLFPDDAVSITDFRPSSPYDRKVIYRFAASLLSSVGCSLAAPFMRAMGDDFTVFPNVTNLRFTGEAISADIDQHHIIMGDDAAMRRAGFRINRMQGRTVVYMSIDADVAASFALNYNTFSDTEYSLRLLIRNLRIPVIAARDFNITVDRVEKSFRIRPGVVVCPPIETRVALANPDLKYEATGVVFLKSGIRAAAETIEGSRRFKTVSTLSLVIGLVSGFLGLLLTLLLLMNGWFDSLTPFNLFLYQLLWSLPSFFLALWSKKY